MSVYVTMYAQAKVNGVWRSIDYWQRSINGQLVRVPVMMGQSTLAMVVRECDAIQRTGLQYVAPEIAEMITENHDGVTLFQGISLYELNGSDLIGRDLDQMEICGFFENSDVAKYKADPNYPIWEVEYLSPREYNALAKEAKRAYTYLEVTDPYGEFATLKRLRAALIDRVNTFNDPCLYNTDSKTWHFEHEITLADAKIIITED